MHSVADALSSFQNSAFNVIDCSSDFLCLNYPGEVLETLNTNQVNNSFACISPCGRFVASAG